MYVRMLKSLITPAETFLEGHVYDVGSPQASRWSREHKAVRTNCPPPAILNLHARLNDGAFRPCLFLPPAGMEFGHEIMTHVRIVHFHKASRKIVCCRPGCEVLYPDADGFETDWKDPVPDADRVGTKFAPLLDWAELKNRHPGLHPVAAGGLGHEEALCTINPNLRIPFKPRLRGIRTDVVFGIRKREFWPARNWPHWRYLADRLREAGVTYSVVGNKATSEDLAGQRHHSGDTDTDAAVELLQSCRLYIGTDCGVSHLAAAAGCPMLVFREVLSGSPDLVPRMQTANPGRVLSLADGWENPGAVAREALGVLFRDKSLATSDSPR